MNSSKKCRWLHHKGTLAKVQNMHLTKGQIIAAIISFYWYNTKKQYFLQIWHLAEAGNSSSHFLSLSYLTQGKSVICTKTWFIFYTLANYWKTIMQWNFVKNRRYAGLFATEFIPRLWFLPKIFVSCVLFSCQVQPYITFMYLKATV